jgi:hypothetical protein
MQEWRMSVCTYMTDIFTYFEYVLDTKLNTAQGRIVKKAHS